MPLFRRMARSASFSTGSSTVITLLAVLRSWIALLVLRSWVAPTALAKCPNYCNQRGICTGPGDDAFCICEHGYQGDDCGTRMCPKGDDPLTTGQSDRALMLRTTAEGAFLEGDVTFTFNGESASLNADAYHTGDRECALALESMRNIGSVSCQRGAVNEMGGADYIISLLSFPTYPYENNLYGHTGNPSLEAFSCNISTYKDEEGSPGYPSCELVDVATENIKEYVECSRHGTCVRETGRCDCNFGFHGDACDDISDSDDAQMVLAEGPFFTGSMLKLRAKRGLSPQFDMLRAIAGDLDVMTLTGNGDLILHQGSLLIKSPRAGIPTKNVGWRTETPPEALVVSGGSLGVAGGSAKITSSRSNAPALAVTVEGGWGDGTESPYKTGFLAQEALPRYSGAAVDVTVLQPGSDQFRLLELSTLVVEEFGSAAEVHGHDTGQDTAAAMMAMTMRRNVLSVQGDGRISMAGGGGVVLEEGDLEVSQGDAKFKGSATVGHALLVGAGGIKAAAGGIRILDGGFEAHASFPGTRGDKVYNKVSSSSETEDDWQAGSRPEKISAVGLLSASHQDFAGDVLRVDAREPGAVKNGAVLIRATVAGEDVFEVKATGETSVKTGGLNVHAGGLRIGSGGVAVESGGIVVDGGIRLRSGKLTIDTDGDGSGEVATGNKKAGVGQRGMDGFEVASGGIRAVSKDESTPALAADVEAVGFGGAVLSLSARRSSASESFRLLQGTVARVESGKEGEDGNGEEDQEEVFIVDGTGKVTAAGGIETGVTGAVVAAGGIVSSGKTVLERHFAMRDGVGGCEIDAGLGTFFEIPDDGKPGSANVVLIKGGARAGQVLVVRNADGDPSTGVAAIPPGYTVMFIYDGGAWRDLRVLEAAITKLSGVTAFTAANDLDVGDVTVTAQHFVSSGNEGGHVALYGGGGLLTSDRGFTWDPATGTLSVPRLRTAEVADGIDFRGKPARNVALVNATLDRVPFIKTGRFMLESAAGVSSAGGGLAVFSNKGELSREESVRARPGGFLDVNVLGPHTQAGDVDFQGHTARNISLVGVSALTGLDRLEIGSLFLPSAAHNALRVITNTSPSPSPSSSSAAAAASASANNFGNIIGGAVMVLTGEGELKATGDGAGDFVSVEPGTGTLLTSRIGPHDVTGDVDFLGNTVRGAVLESPDIRGFVPSLHAGELSISRSASVSQGFLAVLSTESQTVSSDGSPAAGASTLGRAAGATGRGVAFRDGALHNLRLGGTTTLEGDLDLAGHRLLNSDMAGPKLDELEELTVLGTLRLDAHASSPPNSLLTVGPRGLIGPADPASLTFVAASMTLFGPAESGELRCRGAAEVGGKLEVGGGVTVGGELELGGGLNARGNRITNAYLENPSVRGRVLGGVVVEGGMKIGELATDGGAGAEVGGDDGIGRKIRMVAAGPGGELRTTRGMGFDDENGVLVAPKIAGHQVTGSVNFAGQALLSAALNFSSGGGIDGLSSLAVGEGGLEVEGLFRAESDGIFEGSVTVAGAVMGRGPYMDSSDVRLKTDIEEISGREASSIVRKLRGITYIWNSNHHNSHAVPEGRQHGFIAQELGELLPELVSEDSRGYKVVAYSRLVPTLTASLSWALGRLDALESLQQAGVSSATKSRAADYSIDEAFTGHDGLGALRQRSGQTTHMAIAVDDGADIAVATAAAAIFAAEAKRRSSIGDSSSSAIGIDIRDGDPKPATQGVTRVGIGIGIEAVSDEPDIGTRFAASSTRGVSVPLGGGAGVSLGNAASERGGGRESGIEYLAVDEAKSVREMVEENSILREKVASLEARLEDVERKIGTILQDRSLDV